LSGHPVGILEIWTPASRRQRAGLIIPKMIPPQRRSARFIRLWDTDDRDPATARRVLSKFRAELDTLFVRGYILCEATDSRVRVQVGPCAIAGPRAERRPLAAPEPTPAPKTITQIALEECLKAPEVQVNGRTKRLGGGARKQDAQELMAQVKSVVADALGRLDADFSEDALYLCLEAFDLHLWEEMVRNLRIRDQVAELSAQVRALRQRSKTLFLKQWAWACSGRCLSEQQTSRSQGGLRCLRRFRSICATGWLGQICDSAGQ